MNAYHLFYEKFKMSKQTAGYLYLLINTLAWFLVGVGASVLVAGILLHSNDIIYISLIVGSLFGILGGYVGGCIHLICKLDN